MGERLIKKIKYWAQILLLPIYWFSFLMPRNRDIWLFGSTFGDRFADNPRYFYLFVSQHHKKEIEAIWISKNRDIISLLTRKGYKAFYKYSVRGFWYCLKGGLYIYDNYPKDISHFLSGGAKKINLWHGLPLKKIQKDNIHDIVRNPKNIKEFILSIPRRLSDEKPSHYVLVSSKFFSAIFASAFQTNKIIISGYPRCDTFMSSDIKNIYNVDERKSLEFIRTKKNAGINMIILYMPTFRDSETKFFETVCLSELQIYLEENGFILCIKLHCKSKLKEKFEQIDSDHIHIISSQADPYCFIKNSDLLITDYSSIYFDYLLSGKSLLFFPYDYKEYISESRELYFVYDEFIPGKKVTTMQELKAAISTIFIEGEEERYKNRREDMKRTLFGKNYYGGSEHLYKVLSNLR